MTGAMKSVLAIAFFTGLLASGCAVYEPGSGEGYGSGAYAAPYEGPAYTYPPAEAYVVPGGRRDELAHHEEEKQEHRDHREDGHTGEPRNHGDEHDHHGDHEHGGDEH